MHWVVLFVLLSMVPVKGGRGGAVAWGWVGVILVSKSHLIIKYLSGVSGVVSGRAGVGGDGEEKEV